MKMSEIRELSVPELKQRLSDEEEGLANLRFQLSTSQLESPIRVRTVRRDIARIKTLIQQKEVKEPRAKAAAKVVVKQPTRPRTKKLKADPQTATPQATTEVKNS